MFIDALALQFLVLPMLIPIAEQFGIDMIFFGVMTTLNMMIEFNTANGYGSLWLHKLEKCLLVQLQKGVLPL